MYAAHHPADQRRNASGLTSGSRSPPGASDGTRVKSAWRDSAAKFGVVGGAVLHAPRRKAREVATGCGLMSRWSSARTESGLSRLGHAIHSTLSLDVGGMEQPIERRGRRRLGHQLVEAVRMHVRTDRHRPFYRRMCRCLFTLSVSSPTERFPMRLIGRRQLRVLNSSRRGPALRPHYLVAPQLRLGRARDIGGRNTWLLRSIASADPGCEQLTRPNDTAPESRRYAGVLVHLSYNG